MKDKHFIFFQFLTFFPSFQCKNCNHMCLLKQCLKGSYTLDLIFKAYAFSQKTNVALDKVSNGSEKRCTKELKNRRFISGKTIVMMRSKNKKPLELVKFQCCKWVPWNVTYNISYLSPMCTYIWEKCIESQNWPWVQYHLKNSYRNDNYNDLTSLVIRHQWFWYPFRKFRIWRID